ncbi:hypothetical protein Kpho02_73810 [Kitasatospora phosalacinea]|uniref:Uncharacterized protein n=1 Tax=Kitasatospora phosalacinea TaxID=2065 RepID=A0A9W6QHG1_9ACTN|nr:hypothetical protein [Kitasatospora phosalacinea]GLW75084.1 hypothetical protein Kpho02_73810 [Kitasatospora phosalacinea]
MPTAPAHHHWTSRPGPVRGLCALWVGLAALGPRLSGAPTLTAFPLLVLLPALPLGLLLGHARPRRLPLLLVTLPAGPVAAAIGLHPALHPDRTAPHDPWEPRLLGTAAVLTALFLLTGVVCGALTRRTSERQRD